MGKRPVVQSIVSLTTLFKRQLIKYLSNRLSLFVLNKNSAEVNIAPAFGEITTACNVGQTKNGSWCLLEE